MTHGKVVRLGYEIGTGTEVSIPVRHTVVTGQTQESGKTTTLEALIERAQLRAVTFITKRGEGSFGDARRIDPYFRERADWQFVASILEASRGEKLKFERAWIIRASKGARTLADVQRNVRTAMKKATGMSADVYLTLDAYLDVVVPQISTVRWAPRVELVDGVNAMDLTRLSVELQHLVIRSTLEWILEHEQNTVVVVPEAWKFIPQGRGTPVKLAAEAFIRQAAGLANYLWLDSQDIAGVEKIILKSVPVWILGVQREANEIKRTLDNIPAGIAKPKAADIATLEIGQFYACWGRHAIKTYVQPAWMPDDDEARAVAAGELSAPRPPTKQELSVNESEARALREENEQLRRQVEDLTSRLGGAIERSPAPLPETVSRAERPARAVDYSENGHDEDLYQRIKQRLVEDAPALIKVLASRPAIEVEITREVIRTDGKSLRGRIARMIADGFWASPRTSADVGKELEKQGAGVTNIELGNELKALTTMGFFTRENKWISLVEGAEVNVVER